MQINGLYSQVRVRGVYAADTYAIVLCNQHGQSIKDDLVVRLIGWRAKTIERPIEPPLLTARCYPVGATEGEILESGPCPEGRTAAQRIVKRASAIHAVVPISGDGYLESLVAGIPVAGEIYVDLSDGDRQPISSLLQGEHLVASSDPSDPLLDPDRSS